MTFVYAVAIVLAIAILAAIVSERVRGFLSAVWRKWFKDSEVNLLADLATAAGAVAEILLFLDNPAMTELLQSMGLSPKVMMIIGILIRLARASRAWHMLPFTKDE